MIELDFAKLNTTPVVADPFPHVLVPGFVPPAALDHVLADLPPLARRGSFPVDSVRLGPHAKALMDAMEGPLLRASIERFNGFCRNGVDEDFGRGGRAFDRFHGDPTVKPNANLGAIEKPPFYACRIVPGDVGTSGGLLTDENARVLRADGTPIEGLYACGNSAATVVGHTYPGAGASIGHSFIFGYRAALHMAGNA